MVDGIPLGHSISTHVVFGWCSYCKDHETVEEVDAWRVWAMSHVPDVVEAVNNNGKRAGGQQH